MSCRRRSRSDERRRSVERRRLSPQFGARLGYGGRRPPSPFRRRSPVRRQSRTPPVRGRRRDTSTSSSSSSSGYDNDPVKMRQTSDEKRRMLGYVVAPPLLSPLCRCFKASWLSHSDHMFMERGVNNRLAVAGMWCRESARCGRNMVSTTGSL